jgi:hypothetical protein
MKHIPIDKDIFPLVKALNDMGLTTIESCAGHGKLSYVKLDYNKIKHIHIRGDRVTIWWKIDKQDWKDGVPVTCSLSEDTMEAWAKREESK